MSLSRDSAAATPSTPSRGDAEGVKRRLPPPQLELIMAAFRMGVRLGILQGRIMETRRILAEMKAIE